MEITETRYPIGVQSFEKLRQEGYMYIDKTGYIRKLLKNDYYFLSRPRRFGKSLLLSTLEAYFRGKKELFEGLEVYGHEHGWVGAAMLGSTYSTENPVSLFFQTGYLTISEWDGEDGYRLRIPNQEVQ